ncbi:HET-domain-containing protein [Daldinia eschscholtzii]|nr:HET-domain-containing protein [Daldinia eschscholtzii]
MLTRDGSAIKCEICSKIDFQHLFATADELFTRSFPHMPPTTNGRVDNYSQVWEEQQSNPTVLFSVPACGIFESRNRICTTCAFFEDLAAARTQYRIRTPDGHHRRIDTPRICRTELQSITICSSMRLCLSIFDALELSTAISTALLGLFDRGFVSLTANKLNHMFNRNFLPNSLEEQAIFRTLPEHDIPSPGVFEGIWGRIISEWVDFAIPKQWLNFCRSNHAKICLRPRLKDRIEGFRLIDCARDPVSIESCTLERNYVALSYVWATSTKPSNEWPNVVLHAIEVTKRLGFRYLWVDRYCIDQSNEREKAHQISNMHLIFQQAEITLVAATDEFDGLSGVRSGSSDQLARKVQKKVEIGDMTLATVLNPILGITQSNWYQRGWTFQEGLLSRRVLVFTSGQLYWNCCGMSERECLYVPPKISHLPDMSEQGGWMTMGLFDRAGKGSIRALPKPDFESPESTENVSWPSISAIGKIHREIFFDIAEYSGRRLSYDSDSLDAFKGIMQMHRARAQNSIKFILGLPIAIIPGLDSNLAFCHALSVWDNSFPYFRRRRYHLPSWTWAGWEGETCFIYDTLDGIYSTTGASYNELHRDYCPEVKFITGNVNDCNEYSLKTMLERNGSLDGFGILRVIKPYIMRDITYISSLSVQLDMLLAPRLLTFNEAWARGDIAVVLIYCGGRENIMTPYFLILKSIDDTLDDGQRLWERMGQVHFDIEDEDCLSESLSQTNPGSESVDTTDDLVDLMNSVRSEVDYFIV